ncbi:MAG TPA: amino acid ABC transporter permease, partial [Propionibacteriaceae bacterium]|nr:amino acid ABC transporter permease [Propionibacteriaceae bacterium]
ILYPELIRSGQTLASSRGNLIPTFLVIAVIYIVINYLLTLLARYLERRLQVARRAPKVPPAGAMLDPDMAPAGAAAAPADGPRAA